MDACVDNSNAEGVDVAEMGRGRSCRTKRRRPSHPSRPKQRLKSNLCRNLIDIHSEHHHECNNDGPDNQEKANRSSTPSAPCDATRDTVVRHVDNIVQEAGNFRSDVCCDLSTCNENNTNEGNGNELVANAEEGKRVSRKRYKPKKFDDYEVEVDLPERANKVLVVSSESRSHGKQPIYNPSQNLNFLPPNSPFENLQGRQNVSRLPHQSISRKPIKYTTECNKDTRQDNARKSRVQNRSRFQLMAAKQRWKDLAKCLLADAKEQAGASTAILGLGNAQPCTLASLDDQLQHKASPQKRKNSRTRKVTTSRGARTIKEKKHIVESSKHQGLHTGQVSILKQMKLWMTGAKFTKRTIQNEGISAGAGSVEFLIGEDDRVAFVQKVVNYCQKNAKLRSLFLDSVKVLAKNSIMQFAASKMLENQNLCEEAQGVVQAWENYQVQDPTARKLPMDLFKAVVQLHNKLEPSSSSTTATTDMTNVFSFNHTQNRVWQIRLPDDGSLTESLFKTVPESSAG